MNIVHVLFNMRMGGTETMLIDIINRQAEAGHTVTLLLINSGHQQELMRTISPAVNIVELNRPQGSKNPLWILRFNAALRRLHPDAVHIHNKQALGMLYGPRNFKVIFTYHRNGDVNRYWRRADELCAISHTVAADAASRGEGKPTVVMNGIDTSALPHRQGALHTPARLVQIGSLRHMVKGQHITIEALALMRHSDAAVDFYGTGPSKDELAALAEKLGVGHRVRFMGNLSRKELYNTLSDYDIGLLPSLDEGFGLALAEPMAAGLPVVCSSLPGPMEVLDVTGAGESAEPGNSQALADAIDKILDNYDHYCRRAADGFNSMAANLDISSTVAKYLDAYRRP